MAEYVSISELTPEFYGEQGELVHPILWELNLPPHVDSEKIVLNASRMRHMHFVGAMGGSVVGSYEGDTTETTPEIVGINSDGSAIAGRSVVTKKADSSKGAFLDETDIRFADMMFAYRGPNAVSKTFGKTTAMHRLNRPELASRVTDRVQQDGASSEKAWAKELDIAMRQSMRKAGRSHLCQRAPIFERMVMSMAVGNIIVDPALTAAGQYPTFLSAMAVGVYMLGQAVPELTRLNVKLQTGIDNMERRWSLFPYSVQYDRYAVLNGLSRASGLIKLRK